MLKKNKIVCVMLFFIMFVWVGYINFNKSVVYENESKIHNFYDTTNNYKYFGILKIKKINLENILYLKSDIQNNVNRNVYVVSDNADFIVLAAHSGDSAIAYFKNLDKLKIGDTCELILNNKKREYILFNKQEILKNGKANIKKYNYPIAVLITCSKVDKTKQEVYYFRLKNSQKLA